MKINQFKSEQIPVAVRRAIRDALVERAEKEKLSTYALAERLNSSQSTVYNATKHARFGRMFAEISLEWLGTDLDSIVAKYGEPSVQPATPDKKAAGKLVPSIRVMGSKLGWLPITLRQVEALYAETGDSVDLGDLRRAGNMYDATNKDILADA